MSARYCGTALTLLILALAPPAGAGVRTHEVAAGESVSSIAKHYYGSYEPAPLLLQFNAKTSHVIRAGEKLRVPYCDVHRVRSGDTWSTLSKRYVGRSSAYRGIALLNGLSVGNPLRIDQTLVMPVAIPYRLARGDTLGNLAERYYGDPTLAVAIQEFNEIEDPRRMSVGQAIDVPLVTLRLRKKAAPPRTVKQAAKQPSKPAPAKAAPPAKKQAPRPEPPVEKVMSREPHPKYRAEIDEVRQDFIRAEYDRARERAEQLRPLVDRDGTPAERAELLRLQAFVYVAFELPEQACDAYRSLVELSPSIGLNPQLVSPKIRSTLAACQDG